MARTRPTVFSPLQKHDLLVRRQQDVKKKQDELLDLFDLLGDSGRPAQPGPRPVPRGVMRVEEGPELPPYAPPKPRLVNVKPGMQVTTEMGRAAIARRIAKDTAIRQGRLLPEPLDPLTEARVVQNTKILAEAREGLAEVIAETRGRSLQEARVAAERELPPLELYGDADSFKLAADIVLAFVPKQLGGRMEPMPDADLPKWYNAMFFASGPSATGMALDAAIPVALEALMAGKLALSKADAAVFGAIARIRQAAKAGKLLRAEPGFVRLGGQASEAEAMRERIVGLEKLLAERKAQGAGGAVSKIEKDLEASRRELVVLEEAEARVAQAEEALAKKSGVKAKPSPVSKAPVEEVVAPPHFLSQSDKDAQLADLRARLAAYEASIAAEPRAQTIAQRDVIKRAIKVAEASPVAAAPAAPVTEAAAVPTTKVAPAWQSYEVSSADWNAHWLANKQARGAMAAYARKQGLPVPETVKLQEAADAALEYQARRHRGYQRAYIGSPQSPLVGESIVENLTEAELVRWSEMLGVDIPPLATGELPFGVTFPRPAVAETVVRPRKPLDGIRFFKPYNELPGMEPSAMAVRMSNNPVGKAMMEFVNARSFEVETSLGKAKYGWVENSIQGSEVGGKAGLLIDQELHGRPELVRLRPNSEGRLVSFKTAGGDFAAWNDVYENGAKFGLNAVESDFVRRVHTDFIQVVVDQMKAAGLPVPDEVVENYIGRVLLRFKEAKEERLLKSKLRRKPPGPYYEREMETATQTLNSGIDLESDVGESVAAVIRSLTRYGADEQLKAFGRSVGLKMSDVTPALAAKLAAAQEAVAAAKAANSGVKQAERVLRSVDAEVRTAAAKAVGEKKVATLPFEGLDDLLFTDVKGAEALTKGLMAKGYYQTGELAALATLAGAIRTMTLAVDLSAMIINGSLMVVTPALIPAWRKATGNMFLALGSPKMAYKVFGAREHQWAVNEMIEQGMGLKSLASIRATEGGSEFFAGVTAVEKAMGATLGKVPIVGKPVTTAIGKTYERAQVMFDIWGDTARLFLWESLRHKAATAQELRELADFVGKITGYMDTRRLGLSQGVRSFENLVLWVAPRYTRAGIGLVADAAQGWAVGTGRLRGDLARKTFLAFLAGSTFTYVSTMTAYEMARNGGDFDKAFRVALSRMMPIKQNKSGKWILNSQFMSFPVGTAEISPFGGIYRSMTSLVARMITTSAESPRDWVPWSRSNPLVRTWLYRAAPPAQIVYELQAGETVVGDPLESLGDWARYGASHVTPIALQSLYEQHEGIPETWWERGIKLGMEAMGGRGYDQSVWLQRADVRDQIAQREWKNVKEYFDESLITKAESGKLGWDDLPVLAKDRLEDGSGPLAKQLRDLNHAIDKSVARRGGQSAVDLELRQKLEEIRAKENGQLVGIQELVDGGTRTYEQARDDIQEIKSQTSGAMQSVLTNSRYIETLERWKESREERLEEGKQTSRDMNVDLVYTFLLGGDFWVKSRQWDAEKGEMVEVTLPIFKGAEYERAEQAVISMMGEDAYYQARQDILDRKDTPRIAVEWYEAQQVMRPYWDAWESLPPASRKIYAEYQAVVESNNGVAVEEWEASHKAFLSKVQPVVDARRLALRRADKELQRVLQQWGYVGPLPVPTRKYRY